MQSFDEEEAGLQLSLETLMDTSPLLGVAFEDRRHLRSRQHNGLLALVQKNGSVHLNRPGRFYFGCLDFLVSGSGHGKRFHPIEFNGTGMAGVFSISTPAIQGILKTLRQAAEFLPGRTPLFLAPLSGTQNIGSSASSSWLYERMFYAEAIREGMRRLHGRAKLLTLPEIVSWNGFSLDQPTVVLGHHKDFIQHLSCLDGQIYLFDQPVSGAMRDQFCDNLFSYFRARDEQVNPATFYPVNPIYPLGGDKGFFYGLLNRFLARNSFKGLPEQVLYSHACNWEQLIAQVRGQLAAGRKVVIKPHASGLGRGIDFFVRPESEEQIVSKIEASIEATEKFYGTEGAAFPYTVCEFIDGAIIEQADHPLEGHKYELRVMLYAEGQTLKAFPSIVKIAGKRYNEADADRLMLMNNIAVSTNGHQVNSDQYLLPLCNYETLDMLGIDPEELAELCRFSTGLLAYCIEEMDIPDPAPRIIMDDLCPESQTIGVLQPDDFSF